MNLAHVKLWGDEGHVAVTLLVLDAVVEVLIVDHLPGAVRVIEAGDGSGQVRAVGEAARGRQESCVLACKLGHPDSISWHAGGIFGDVNINPGFLAVIQIFDI